MHDSVPETFATKFSGGSHSSGNCSVSKKKLGVLLAHRVICVNHPQRDTPRRAWAHRFQDVRLDECARPKDLQSLVSRSPAG